MQIPNLSFCVIICLYLPCITAAAFFSILRRLGDFTSRNRKKRFNSWNTQLCLWFTVAAFHSSTAAERTHSILWMKKKHFLYKLLLPFDLKNNQPTNPTSPMEPLLFTIFCSWIWQLRNTWWTNYGSFLLLWLKRYIINSLEYQNKSMGFLHYHWKKH